MSTYTHLGCVVNDRLDCSNIYGEASGRNGVSGFSLVAAWLKRCQLGR